MVYKQRSKYTPGGGVLAFFEQVSRFISLSVLGWVILSLFFILFGTDSKVTDSFDLGLFSSLFTNGQYLMTALMLIGLSGVLGALISVPSAVVLLITRQYLDYHVIRLGSRRYSFVRERILRYVPVAVLVLSHAVCLLLSLASAPQLARNWLSEGNRLSELIAGGHFVLTSMSRSASAPRMAFTRDAQTQPDSGVSNNQASHTHLFLVPAEQMDNPDFRSELGKYKQAVSVPFVIQRSSVNELLESLMMGISGETAELARKTIALPKSYNKIVEKKNAQTLVSISPQIRFGKELAGYGTEYLTGFNDSIMHLEARRRLVLSQSQLFGVFRLFNGVPFLSSTLSWLNLLADDVSRIRSMSKVLTQLDDRKNSIIIIQLFGLEQVFSSVNPPFRPIGWRLNRPSYESRIVNKKLTREIIQYLNDFARSDNDHWVILPYADDRRVNPLSVAFFSGADPLFKPIMNRVPGSLSVSEDFAEALDAAMQKNAQSKLQDPQRLISSPRLECFETELDLKNQEFAFQPVFQRERSLGQLLNYLPQMKDSDLSFLGRSGTSFVTRELGLGFLCRRLEAGVSELYLLKYRGTREQVTSAPSGHQFYSALVDWGYGGTRAKIRANLNTDVGDSVPEVQSPIHVSRDVLEEFTVTRLTQEPSGPSTEEISTWKQLSQESKKLFFDRYKDDILTAVDHSARARIR